MAQSLSMSIFGHLTGGGARDRLSQSAAIPEAPPPPLSPPSPLGTVQVTLEGLPQVFATLRVHSEQDLQVGVAQAFGFRSTADFEILRPSMVDGNASGQEEQKLKVRVLSRTLLNEVAHIESLYSEVVDFEAEVVYSQLAKISGIPLLRLHRAIAPACGEAVASWLATYHEELRQVTALRDSTLQDAAGQRVWRALQHRIEAVLPGLVDRLPQHLKRLPPAESSAEEHLEHISSLFSQILDEVRLRVLPLRTLRTTSNGTWDTKRVRPGSKRLLRVSFQGSSESQASSRPRPTVFIASLDTQMACPSSLSSGSGTGSAVGSSSPCGGTFGGGSPSGAGVDGDGQASCGFTGHDLYYQVARFFGLTHVEVRSRDGTLISLQKPDESLLGQLPGASDGICVDLIASVYQPQTGSFDQLYREVLRILGPRHFKLDQSYRLQLQCSEEMLTTTQGNALISTVIVIPINYLEGKQMYLFRSPRYRQCTARLRTFEEFKEMLQTLVHVYEQLTNQMTPAQAERLRGNSAEGAPGQTPLAPFEGSRAHSLSQTWQLMHGEATAGRSVMGLLGGFQTSTSAPKVGGSGFCPLWFMPEEMLIDTEVLYVAHDVLCEYHEAVGVRYLLGGPFTGVADATAPKARSIFDRYGIDQMQAHESATQRWSLPQWWRSPHQAEAEGQVAPWTDPWSIVVGGLVGVLFGLFEGVYGSANEQSLYNTTNTRILEKMARRGFIGLGVSAAFHFLGRLLRQCHPGCRYTAVSRKSVLASQAAVFLGTAAWAVASRQKYVSPGFFRRLWVQDLNLAEFQAAGIILTSGLACSFSFGGYVLGAQVLGGSLGGPVGAFAGSLMPIFISVALVGLDWWHDRRRRHQMKAAALQTLGLPEPSELGLDVFKPMLSTRYKLLACYLHPDKNDNCRCDTTKVFSQIRLAKEILEQELKDYQGCPRERLRRLFLQMCALCGYRRDRYVCEHPTGIVMNILEDGRTFDEDVRADFNLEHASSSEAPLASPRRHGLASPGQTHRRRSRSESSRSGIDSLTTVESRSLSASRSCSPLEGGRRGRAPLPEPSPQEWARQPSRPSTPRSRLKSEGVTGSGDSNEPPWVLVGRGAARQSSAGTRASQAVPSVPEDVNETRQSDAPPS